MGSVNIIEIKKETLFCQKIMHNKYIYTKHRYINIQTNIYLKNGSKLLYIYSDFKTKKFLWIIIVLEHFSGNLTADLIVDYFETRLTNMIDILTSIWEGEKN